MDVFNTASILMILVFVIGYVFITIEHYTHVNKATVAILMAVVCWALEYTIPPLEGTSNARFFEEHLANVAQVVFFLMGAMTIVEIINVHQGFNVITSAIHISSKKKLLWVMGFITFFLSAVLDNLTTTVVMVTLLARLIPKGEERLLYGGAAVIAANAGGAWTPIGDVTTTMLWIGEQLSSLHIIKTLFLPSLACLVIALAYLSTQLKGEFPPLKQVQQKEEPFSNAVFFLGLAALIFVPIFRAITGLPPFMGILFGLGILWLFTDLFHAKFEDRHHLRVPHVLSKIDLSGALFFLGILLCIDALDSAHLLDRLARFLDDKIGNVSLIAIAIGLASAVIDNVPLVAATMGMYDLANFPTDHSLWTQIAFTAGTGGSILLIGSAAGVVFMGMEKVDFMWYLRKISLPALLGFLGGIGVYLLLFH